MLSLYQFFIGLGMPPSWAFAMVYSSLAAMLVLPWFIISRWDDIRWYLYDRYAFNAWSRKQEDRIAFLQRSGTSRAVAIATVLNDATKQYQQLSEPVHKQRWATRRASALEALLVLRLDDLLRIVNDDSESRDHRIAAAEAGKHYAEGVDASVEQALHYLKNLH